MSNKYLLLFFLILIKCGDPNLIDYPFIFHFHSDLNDIGLKNLKINVSTESGKQFNFDSTDFTVCPDTNDTCKGRTRYTEVQGYTLRVPMTEYYELTAADGKVTINSFIEDNDSIICHGEFSFKPFRYYDYLIYLGKIINKDSGIIADFDKVLNAGYREFYYNAQPFVNIIDSLYIGWMD